jgi:hypothetical protein
MFCGSEDMAEDEYVFVEVKRGNDGGISVVKFRSR